jgi:hypothetical protein
MSIGKRTRVAGVGSAPRPHEGGQGDGEEDEYPAAEGFEDDIVEAGGEDRSDGGVGALWRELGGGFKTHEAAVDSLAAETHGVSCDSCIKLESGASAGC